MSKSKKYFKGFLIRTITPVQKYFVVHTLARKIIFSVFFFFFWMKFIPSNINSVIVADLPAS